MVLALATGPYAGQETGETALFRTLFDDLVLSDRYYGGGALLALLRELGVEFTTRRHQYRAADFRRGKRSGKGDHIVAWAKPQKPGRFDQETYDRLLRQLAVRELEVRVNVPGFLTASLVVVTSRVDHQVWAPDDLAGLYLSRPKRRDWRAACRQAAGSGPSQETLSLTAHGSPRTSHLGPCKVYLVAAGDRTRTARCLCHPRQLDDIPRERPRVRFECVLRLERE